jgi:hypothetical protein
MGSVGGGAAQLRVDRAKLLEFVCGYPKEFDAMVSSIEVRMHPRTQP